ncbi:MAG: hypothetical protein ACRELF_24920, partial [Gemmataceae bacterium]
SYMFSAAKIKILAWLQAAELPLYLGAAWVLTAKWGALGAAVVWSARLVLDYVARSVIVHRSARLPWIPLSQRRARSLLAPSLLGVASIAAAALTRGLVARAGLATVLMVTYGAAVWWVVLTPRERRGVVNLVGEIAGRDIAPRRRPAHARRSVQAVDPGHARHRRSREVAIGDK